MNATSQLTAERPIQNNNTWERTSTKNGDCLYHRILFGADFSAGSERVFKHALRLAKQNSAELLVFHAYDLPKTVGFVPADCYEEWLSDYRGHTTDRAKRFVDQAHKAGVRIHVVACEGLPEVAIARAVKKTKVDLVVIGTHGRHGLARFLAGGSTAARILLRANCPVLAVQRDDEAEP